MYLGQAMEFGPLLLTIAPDCDPMPTSTDAQSRDIAFGLPTLSGIVAPTMMKLRIIIGPLDNNDRETC